MQVGRQITARVVTLLNELDPYGLEPGGPDGSPRDEYEFEARSMAELLLRNEAINLGPVDQIWLHWFEEPLSRVVGMPRSKELVLKLNALIKPPSA